MSSATMKDFTSREDKKMAGKKVNAQEVAKMDNGMKKWAAVYKAALELRDGGKQDKALEMVRSVPAVVRECLNLGYTEELVVGSMGFRGNVQERVAEIGAAGIREFILTDRSTELMDILDELDQLGAKFEGFATAKGRTSWGEEKIARGMKIRV